MTSDDSQPVAWALVRDERLLAFADTQAEAEAAVKFAGPGEVRPLYLHPAPTPRADDRA